jgi:hypothetical protein
VIELAETVLEKLGDVDVQDLFSKSLSAGRHKRFEETGRSRGKNKTEFYC